MAKRVTIMLDDKNNKALRREQAKQLLESDESISFSNVINQAVERGLKK